MKLGSGQYFGDIQHTINLKGLILTKSNYKSRSLTPRHYHQNPYFCYVMRGSYSEHSAGKYLSCVAGDIIFHPGETEHHNSFNDDNSCCFNLELSSGWVERIFGSKLNPDAVIKTNLPDIQKTFIKIYREFNEFDVLSPLMIEGLMIGALITFSRNDQQNSSNPYYIRKVRNYIDELYFTNPCLSELAAISTVSQEHLTREFKRAFNMTIGEYMREVKVKHACDKLKRTNEPLADIAFETGFSDQSHFNRVFKKLIGLTPLEYRLAK